MDEFAIVHPFTTDTIVWGYHFITEDMSTTWSWVFVLNADIVPTYSVSADLFNIAGRRTDGHLICMVYLRNIFCRWLVPIEWPLVCIIDFGTIRMYAYQVEQLLHNIYFMQLYLNGLVVHDTYFQWDRRLIARISYFPCWHGTCGAMFWPRLKTIWNVYEPYPGTNVWKYVYVHV